MRTVGGSAAGWAWRVLAEWRVASDNRQRDREGKARAERERQAEGPLAIPRRGGGGGGWWRVGGGKEGDVGGSARYRLCVLSACLAALG